MSKILREERIEREQGAAARFLAGETVEQLATAYGVARRTVQRWLRAQGASRPPVGGGRRGRAPLLNADELAKLRELAAGRTPGMR